MEWGCADTAKRMDLWDWAGSWVLLGSPESHEPAAGLKNRTIAKMVIGWDGEVQEGRMDNEVKCKCAYSTCAT
jgi:hypothetical protein